MSGEFDAAAMLKTLDRHGVQFVLIGGYAAQLHGAQKPTVDLDVTPERSEANLDRLAAALRELDAGIRVDGLDKGLPFPATGQTLAGIDTLNLTTRHGDLDLVLRPDGLDGYEDLARHAAGRVVDGVTVYVASLDDIIRSKDAAGRLKDVDALPELRALANRLDMPTSPRSSPQSAPGHGVDRRQPPRLGPDGPSAPPR